MWRNIRKGKEKVSMSRAILFLLALPLAADAGELRGVVVDEKGRPVEGAWLSAGGEVARSDAAGRFMLPVRRAAGDGAAGKVTLVAAREGVGLFESEVETDGEDRSPLRVVLGKGAGLCMRVGVCALLGADGRLTAARGSGVSAIRVAGGRARARDDWRWRRRLREVMSRFEKEGVVETRPARDGQRRLEWAVWLVVAPEGAEKTVGVDIEGGPPLDWAAFAGSPDLCVGVGAVEREGGLRVLFRLDAAGARSRMDAEPAFLFDLENETLGRFGRMAGMFRRAWIVVVGDGTPAANWEGADAPLARKMRDLRKSAGGDMRLAMVVQPPAWACRKRFSRLVSLLRRAGGGSPSSVLLTPGPALAPESCAPLLARLRRAFPKARLGVTLSLLEHARRRLPGLVARIDYVALKTTAFGGRDALAAQLQSLSAHWRGDVCAFVSMRSGDAFAGHKVLQRVLSFCRERGLGVAFADLGDFPTIPGWFRKAFRDK